MILEGHINTFNNCYAIGMILIMERDVRCTEMDRE